MKTIRLLLLLVWALAHAMTPAGAHPLERVNCAQTVAPILPAAAAGLSQSSPTRTFNLNEAALSVGENLTEAALQQTEQVAGAWREFVNEWLLSRKILWIGMFLLLLLLARL